MSNHLIIPYKTIMYDFLSQEDIQYNDSNFKISDYSEININPNSEFDYNINNVNALPYLLLVRYSNLSYSCIIIEVVIYATSVDECVNMFINYILYGDARTKDEVNRNVVSFTNYDFMKVNGMLNDKLIDKSFLLSNLCIHPNFRKLPKQRFCIYNTNKYKIFMLKIYQNKAKYCFIIKTHNITKVFNIVKDYIDKEINTDYTYSKYFLTFNDQVLSNSIFYESQFETPDDFENLGVVDFELVY